jgi:hypothetical protein
MKQYRCKVINREGRVEGRETLEGSNDNEAFGKAQCYLAENPVRSDDRSLAGRSMCGEDPQSLAPSQSRVRRKTASNPLELTLAS